MANEDKATRYQRLRRRASLSSTALSAIVLAALLFTGGSAAVRDAAASLAGGSFFLTIASYVVIVGVLSWAIQLPLAFYEGVVLERRYELSTQTDASWWRDHLKAGALTLVLGLASAMIIWFLLRWSPGYWWAIAAACFSLLLIGLAQIAPVVLMPLFYDLKPLDRPALVARLVALAERADARVLGVFELRFSDRTRKANAALAGIGRTRRILLSDTLLSDHSDDEIEVILAHELAHHVHRDIWKGLALEGALMALGFYLTDRVLVLYGTSLGLAGKSDIAGLPLLMLAGGAVSLALLPLANSFSRAQERRADRYALEMTKRADAFVSAMKRLAAQNLAEEQPSRLVELLFHSHPSMASRIAAAQAWGSRHAARR